MSLIRRDRASVRHVAVETVIDTPLVGAGEQITAYQIQSDYSVTACELVRTNGSTSNGSAWYRRARGCDVLIDTLHGDYFSSELAALDTALARADALERVHYERYRKAQDTAQRTRRARTAFANRDK
jgi:hypothetical protein